MFVQNCKFSEFENKNIHIFVFKIVRTVVVRVVVWVVISIIFGLPLPTRWNANTIMDSSNGVCQGHSSNGDEKENTDNLLNCKIKIKTKICKINSHFAPILTKVDFIFAVCFFTSAKSLKMDWNATLSLVTSN